MKHIIFFLLILATPALSQKYDYHWFAGEYDLLPGPPSNFVISFNTYPPTVTGMETDYFLSQTHHSLSTKDGQFLYYSNGCSIWRYGTPPVPVTESLNINDFGCSTQTPPSQDIHHGILSLPLDSNKFMLLGFESINNPQCYLRKYMYHIVDFSTNPGTVVEQDKVLANGCFSIAIANRHANGRDWWIVLPDFKENRFYSWLLNPDGFVVQDTQYFGTPLLTKGIKSAEFSPDGTKLAIRDPVNGLAIFDFDRCNGTISNYKMLPIPIYSNNYLVFSPNSRYLFTGDTLYRKLIQYDIKATDIEASKQVVGVDEKFFDTLGFGGGYTFLLTMQRGPNGKIYIFAGQTHYVHVLDFPNRVGAACRFNQRAIVLPSSTFGAEGYYPNYRLGPIDGSACDTLGINNIPMAMFHQDIEDTLSTLAITFTDASYYEPTEWYWTFGDGSSSTEINPVHTYAGAGTYTACLIVKNQYGADTLCRSIVVSGTSGAGDLPLQPQVTISPNPFSTHLRVVLPAMIHGVQPEFKLFDLFGREVLHGTLRDFEQYFAVEYLPKGVYAWEVSWKGVRWSSGKVVKM